MKKDHSNIEKIIHWSKKNLNKSDCDANINSDVVVETPWSLVVKINSNGDEYFTKQTPKELYIEYEIISIIGKHLQGSPTPEIIASNKDLNCFMMKSAGHVNLRSLFDGKLNTAIWELGLDNYMKIVRGMGKNETDFLKIGAPNWRIEKMPKLLNDLLKDELSLKKEGFSNSELKSLKEYIPKIQNLVERLAKYGIGQTLINADFNEGNLVLNKITGAVTVIDLGESVISHPFFTIAAHLNNIARRYKLDLEDTILESAKSRCLAHWNDATDNQDIAESYKIIMILLPLFFALGVYRLCVATDFKCAPMISFKVADCLRMLLMNLQNDL